MKIEFKVKMKPQYMYNFLINHIYRSFMGAFSILVGIAAIGMAVYSSKGGGSTYMLCYVVVAGLALVYPPIMLWSRARQQVAQSPVFKNPIAYEVVDEGIHVIHIDQDAFGKWEEIYKIRSTGKSIVVYMDKKRAMIWPKECLGEQYDTVVDLIRIKMPAEKVKIR